MSRKTAGPSSSTPVKMTVLIDVETHARLAALASLSRCDRSALAVRFIREGLKGKVAVIDKRKAGDRELADSANRVDPSVDGESTVAA